MTEKQLLFAVLAFESDLIDLAQLTAACRAWATDKSKPLAELLVERGWMTLKNREFIEELVTRKLAKHQHDPRITLNSVVRGDVCDAIKQVEDADIQQSLSSWPSSGPVLIETIGETLTEPEQPKSRYTWVNEVGKGGLGKVWLARDNDLAREVALKEVKPGSASTEAVRRLIKEAQITGQLQHPNIVPVYEVHRDGSRPFYTMKLVKGETLLKAIRRHYEQSRAGHEDPLSLPRLLNVFVNVCEALAYAHSRGIIHRDLKPENIVLGDYGEAIVLDWGLAKQIGSADEETAPVLLTEDAQSQATKLGATPGTPAYMSPEQAAGRVDLLDRRTDVYGLGTILFEILTGQAPHRLTPTPTAWAQEPKDAPKPNIPEQATQTDPQAAHADGVAVKHLPPRLSIHALLQRIGESPTPRARDVDPTISRELDAICATAMSKKRDERYLDAKALAADVKRSLAHQPVSVYRTGAWERLRLWRRRNPVVAALSLFLAVSLLTGIAVSSFFAVQSAGRNRELQKETVRANNKTIETQTKTKEALANSKKMQIEKDRADANADQFRRGLYFSQMNLAQAAWQDAKVGRLLELLKLQEPPAGEPDLRGFEWYYWSHLAHSDKLNLQGHTGPVMSVAFSPDGKRLASASHDQTVKVWDVTSGAEALTLKGHTGSVLSVAFSPDGNRLASGDDHGTVKVWDTMSGAELLILRRQTGAVTCPVNSVAFSPDGKRLASTSNDGTVKVWDVTSGAESLTLKGHTGPVWSVVFSPDGKRLVSASHDQTVKVWDATSGAETLTLKGHTSMVMSVAFSPDGKRLASASHDQTVKVWDATSGAESLTLKGHTSAVTSVAFSPDGNRLASASVDRTVKVWDATGGAESLTLKAHTDVVTSVVFSPDGKRLASASNDGTVKLLDATSGSEALTLKGHTSFVVSVAFSSDGNRLASADHNGTVKVWDATSGAESLALKGHNTSAVTNPVTSVAFSPDGKWLASASWDQTVKVWDATNGAESLTLKGHTSAVWSVVFSADGKRLASAGGNFDGEPGEVKVWDAASGQETLTLNGHTGAVYCVAFSADGKRLASASGDQTVKVWDATSGAETLTLKGHTSAVMSVAFSPDGKWLASASADQTVKVWDATSGAETLTLKGHTNAVTSVAFSPDGKRLASASWDQTVKVWDAMSGTESLTLKGHTEYFTSVAFRPLSSVAFSPDGKRLASASLDLSVKVWDARPWTPELRAEREALSLIHWLRDQDKPQSEWLAAIAADQTLTEPVRQRALQFAREWK